MSDTPDLLARRERRRAIAVGAALLLSFAMLVGLLVFLGPLHVARGTDLDVDFAFAGPIKPGASVRLSGIVVGTVTAVDLLAGNGAGGAAPDKMVRVHARIEERAMPVVTTTSKFYVTTLGVLGEHYLDVEPGAGGAVLTSGARVDGVSLPRPDLLLPRAAGLLARVDELVPGSPEALELMRAATSLMRRLDQLVSAGDGSLPPDVKATFADLQRLVHGAATGVGDGGALRRVLERTDRLEETAEKADLAALVVDVRAALARVDKLAARLEGAPLLEPAKQEQLRAEVVDGMKAIAAVSKRADRLLGAVESGKGGAGKLFWDEAAADDLRALLHGMRENPVRTLLQPGK